MSVTATLAAPRKGDLVVRAHTRTGHNDRRVTDITLGVAVTTDGRSRTTMWISPATPAHRPPPRLLDASAAAHVTHVPASRVDVAAAMAAYRSRTDEPHPFLRPFASTGDLDAFLQPFLR